MRRLSINDTAAMKATRRQTGKLTEEGKLLGTLKGWLVLEINTQSSQITRFTIKSRSGTLIGSAPKASYQFARNTAKFTNSGWISRGTGSFADIKPSAIAFHAVDSWSDRTIKSAINGEVLYR
jgi:hypothetical protein